MLDCCETYEKTARLHRRTFLRAATVGGVLSTTMFGQAVRQASFGAELDNNVLVVLSLRGGIDGLGVVVPHGDPAYYAARPKLALPKAPLLAKDAMFGLNSQMAPLLPLWNAGKFAAVHAVGMNQPNRSHFAAMELIEDADPGSAQRVGWVNRMIGLNAGQQATEAVHINSTMTPGMLFGPEATLSTRGLSGLKIAGTNTHTEARYRQLTTSWSQTPGPLGDAARSALQISREYAETLGGTYTPANGAQYPTEYPATDLADCTVRHRTPDQDQRRHRGRLDRLRRVGHARQLRLERGGRDAPDGRRPGQVACRVHDRPGSLEDRRSRSSPSPSSGDASRRTATGASTTAGAT